MKNSHKKPDEKNDPPKTTFKNPLEIKMTDKLKNNNHSCIHQLTIKKFILVDVIIIPRKKNYHNFLKQFFDMNFSFFGIFFHSLCVKNFYNVSTF
jgi:hypothetical protein